MSGSSPATVLFIAHDAEKSGAPRVTTQLARLLAEEGRRVRVCFPRRGDCEEDARWAGIETVVVDNPPRSLTSEKGIVGKLRLAYKRLTSILGYYRIARRRDVGVVWVGSVVSIFAGIGAWLAGKPVVFHIHEVVAARGTDRFRIWLIKRLSCVIVFAARRGKVSFRPRPRRQQWVYLPNFVDPGRMAVRSDSRVLLRRDLGAAPGNIVILTVAFLLPHKGIDVLLEAFRRVLRVHPNAVLWIAGGEHPAARAYHRELREFVTSHKMGNSVRFLGHREDVPALLAAADVFVLASRFEAFPLSIVEAMAAGLPVVASNVGSISDMVIDGQTGRLVPPENPAALGRALGSYIERPADRRAHGKRACARATRRFTAERAKKQMVDVVESLLPRR